MKTRYLSFTIGILLLIAMGACKKENTESVAVKSTNEKILKFKSLEEFDKSISTVLRMTPENRKIWASEKGFESFGVKCDEVYSNSHPENFTTIEQFKKLVENNSAFLLLEKQENGEFSLETVISKSPFRYFANLEKMYQIDDLIYKVLEKGTISTTSKNIDKLKLINDQNYVLEYEKDPDLVFSTNRITGHELSTQTKSTASIWACGKEADDYESSGNDRTHMWIDAWASNYTNAQGLTCSMNQLHYQVVPYKRIGFVWSRVTRTISLNISASVGHSYWLIENYTYAYQYDTFNASRNNWSTNNAEDVLSGSGVVGGWMGGLDCAGFQWFHCWGDTPSSPTVNLNCN